MNISEELEWRTDEYGNEKCALWLRGIYIGGILHFRTSRNTPNAGRWRGWVNVAPEAPLIEWFDTADKVRAVTLETAAAALAPSPSSYCVTT